MIVLDNLIFKGDPASPQRDRITLASLSNLQQTADKRMASVPSIANNDLNEEDVGKGCVVVPSIQSRSLKAGRLLLGHQ